MSRAWLQEVEAAVPRRGHRREFDERARGRAAKGDITPGATGARRCGAAADARAQGLHDATAHGVGVVLGLPARC